MSKYLEDINTTRCPKCKAMWEHDAGKPDYNQKNDKGEKLTK